MDLLLAIVLLLINTVSLFLIVLGLPGTWVMVVAAAGVAWWQWSQPVGQMFAVGTLVAATVVALLGELLEFAAGMAGAKRAGGTRRGAIGALVGGFVGGVMSTFIIPVPVIGSLIGACLGAFLGALAMELSGGRLVAESFRSGVGAGVGRFFGTVFKLGAGVVIWLILTVASFWP